MRKHLLPFSFVALTALALPAVAQERPSGKLGEYDEIIIKRKSGENAKVTVEIKDGEVLIDGKKMEDYKSDELAVLHRSIRPRNGGMMLREAPAIGMDELVPTPPPAVLGVMTRKEEASGATITMVSEGSAAEKAGLKEGDVITRFNETAINEPQELFEAVAALKPGDKVTITYKRKGKENKVNAVLEKREAVPTFEFNGDNDNDASPFRRMQPNGRGESPFQRTPPMGPRERIEGFYLGIMGEQRLGLSVQDTEDNSGAKVLRVAPGSTAAKAGFQEKDLVTEMAGKAVKNAKDVADTYKANKEKGNVPAKVKRDGKVQTLTITIPKKLNTENL